MKNVCENEMKLEFLSKSCNEAFSRGVISAFVSQLDPTIEEISEIKTAVSEAVTNSIIHGYEKEEGIITIISKIYKDFVQIEIIDKGKGIENIEEARKPLFSSKPTLERAGMGFTIMENFMDSMEIESALGMGTKVILKRKIKSKAPITV